jgi:single-strand DNA-binding protein
MQLITISGNLGRDAEFASTQAGDDVCRFSLGVKQGWGDKASSNWFRCNLWGKRAKSIQPMLYKGMKVMVVGELTIGEYQGKAQYDVRVSEVEFVPREKVDQGGGGSTGSAWDDAGAVLAGADLDDNVPFLDMGHRDDNARARVI